MCLGWSVETLCLWPFSLLSQQLQCLTLDLGLQTKVCCREDKGLQKGRCPKTKNWQKAKRKRKKKDIYCLAGRISELLFWLLEDVKMVLRKVVELKKGWNAFLWVVMWVKPASQLSHGLRLQVAQGGSTHFLDILAFDASIVFNHVSVHWYRQMNKWTKIWLFCGSSLLQTPHQSEIRWFVLNLFSSANHDRFQWRMEL